MPRLIRAEVEGVQALLAALQTMDDGLDRELAAELQAAAEPIAAGARAGMRRGPGPRANAKNPNDRLPHIADTIYATASGRFAQIVSPHPAAVVFEYGGDIHPRQNLVFKARPEGAPRRRGKGSLASAVQGGGVDQTIRIPQLEMAHKAVTEQLPAIERDLERRLDALAARVGL